MTTATAQTTGRRTRITVDVSPELRREVRVEAARRDMNVTRYVTEVLKQHLGDTDKETSK